MCRTLKELLRSGYARPVLAAREVGLASLYLAIRAGGGKPAVGRALPSNCCSPGTGQVESAPCEQNHRESIHGCVSRQRGQEHTSLFISDLRGPNNSENIRKPEKQLQTGSCGVGECKPRLGGRLHLKAHSFHTQCLTRIPSTRVNACPECGSCEPWPKQRALTAY